VNCINFLQIEESYVCFAAVCGTVKINWHISKTFLTSVNECG
jgi:hypothetical protein